MQNWSYSICTNRKFSLNSTSNHGSKSYPSSGLFLLLLQLSDVVLHDVGPEVALKVGQLGRRLDVVLQRLLVDVLVVQDDPLDDALVEDLFVPFLGKYKIRCTVQFQ